MKTEIEQLVDQIIEVIRPQLIEELKSNLINNMYEIIERNKFKKSR